MEKTTAVLRIRFAALAVAFSLASCNGGSIGSNASLPSVSPPAGVAHAGRIRHIVLVIQENRSFDDLFSTFPGADGATYGNWDSPSGEQYVLLQKVNLADKCDWGHSYKGFIADYDGGKMDGFGNEGGSKKCAGKAGTQVYQYVDPTQIQPYWDIAEQYVLGDQMFQTQGSGSFTAHQDLIAGGTVINPQDQKRPKSLVDYPSASPWGCDAPNGTNTSLLLWRSSKIVDQFGRGPFPCMAYETMRDLLDARGKSWKYYTPPEPRGAGALWDAFDAIKAVREGSEWSTNVVKTNTFLTDVTGHTLPDVSWVIPEDADSDHPGVKHDTGPSWVASVVNAVGQSSYWRSTAIVILWDDWGGFYDHVPPPFFDHWGGLGFRVPLMVVSAYARETYPGQPGYISHTQYEFGSVLKFIEETFKLGSLGTTDQRATSISDCFDFTQPARKFQTISSEHSKSYFLHRPPSYLPVDSE